MSISGAGLTPAEHRQREQEFVDHVQRLLDDDRLRIDTTRGRRSASGLDHRVERSDHAVDLKRLMSEMNRPDRELQSQMPVGQTLDVTLSQRQFWIFKQVVGRIKVICVSPTRALLAGQAPAPLKSQEVQKLLSEIPPGLAGVPTTVVLMCTAGFVTEAHELAGRGPTRTVILAEPNHAGGWAIYGPTETKGLVDLFDPEADEAKRNRVREEIESSRGELTGSGIATDRIAVRTQLPLQLVESEIKAYARSNAGLVAKRLDGRVVLFRAGSVPAQFASAGSGGGEMPLIDRIKTLFARKGENEKKIAFLSERRTALSQQRDRGYEDMATQEAQEAQLRRQFGEATGEITKKRVTSQLLQLRKDIERRQQLLAVLNQQINVVSTHLHNLEMVHQGQTAHLPDSDEMASDAAKAEEMLAELEASGELAASVSSGGAMAGLTAEEQALYDELSAEHAATRPAEAGSTSPDSTPVTAPPASTAPAAAAMPSTPARRAQPEAG
jgi:hypothetical protein